MTETFASLRRTGTSRAAGVSAALRKAGFNPLGSGAPRDREGIRVSWSVTSVRVLIDVDGTAAMHRLKDDVWLALEQVGYAVEPGLDDDELYARKADW